MTKIISIDHEGPVIRTHMLFIQISLAAIKYTDSRFYREHHLSMIKYLALKILVLIGGTMTHTELARWTNTKKHNITALVDRMMEERYVTTERSSKDKRVVEITLTDKGRETYEKSTPSAGNIIKQLTRGIGERDIQNFEKVLKIIKSNIERLA
jgi:DNA-binding MarR family transcriptional regulator